MERESRKRRKRRDVKRALLETASAAVGLGIALAAPNAVRIFRSFGLFEYKRDDEIIKRSRKLLVKRGLMSYSSGNLLRLTEKGKAKLQHIRLTKFKFSIPKKWDKRWRVLIFDIPERKRALRDKVRSTLVAIGFVQLQRSVWIFPHDCENLVTLLKADFKIGKELLYMIVDSLEYDSWVKSHFGL